jgi:hypothetical protein
MCHCSKDAAKNHPFKPHGTGVFQAVLPQRHAQLPVAHPSLCHFAFLVAIFLRVPRRAQLALISVPHTATWRLMCHCSKDAAKNHPFKPHGIGVFQAVFPQCHAQLPVAHHLLCAFSRFLWLFLQVFRSGRLASNAVPNTATWRPCGGLKTLKFLGDSCKVAKIAKTATIFSRRSFLPSRIASSHFFIVAAMRRGSDSS